MNLVVTTGTLSFCDTKGVSHPCAILRAENQAVTINHNRQQMTRVGVGELLFRLPKPGRSPGSLITRIIISSSGSPAAPVGFVNSKKKKNLEEAEEAIREIEASS